jgi:GntR family transcriptional repressor for pyruvate dehydrogenase complex
MAAVDQPDGGKRFARLPRRTMVADAARVIQDMIVDGRLRPGEKLPSERALSEALAVSRPTVREAVQSLVAMNVLESRQGSGTYVSALNIEQLLEPMQFVLALSDSALDQLFEVRLLLEPAAAAFAAERATDTQLRALETCVERTLQVGGDKERLLELDIKLHRLVVEGSHNGILTSLLTSLSALATQSRRRTVEIPGVAELTIQDHVRIGTAVAHREPEVARQAMLDHLTRLRAAVAAGPGGHELPRSGRWRGELA